MKEVEIVDICMRLKEKRGITINPNDVYDIVYTSNGTLLQYQGEIEIIDEMLWKESSYNICLKCQKPYHQHIQTGTGEWVCPLNEKEAEQK